MGSANCEIKIIIVVIQCKLNSIIAGPTAWRKPQLKLEGLLLGIGMAARQASPGE